MRGKKWQTIWHQRNRLQLGETVLAWETVQFYNKYRFRFAFFIFFQSFFPVQQQKSTDLLSLSIRRNAYLWFDWISWTKSAASMYTFFYQKSAFLLPCLKQEQTYNIAAGFFSWILKSWFNTAEHESQHSDDCLTFLLWAYYKMLVLEVSDCLYRQRKHGGTDIRLDREHTYTSMDKKCAFIQNIFF